MDLLADKVAQCMALEAENNGNIVENGGENENIGGMNNNLTAVMDLRIAEVNTQLLVVTQFLQRCSGDFGSLFRQNVLFLVFFLLFNNTYAIFAERKVSYRSDIVYLL